MSAAHEIGLIHRDIKLPNLWIEAPSGRVKILDFGLAKPTLADSQETELTASGAVLGTPAYMAPEQALGEKVDFKADLFSLGVVLYRLTTGHGPFHGKTVMAMLTSILTDEPKPVQQLNPAVPTPLARLIHQLLQKKAEDRPRSAALVAEAIQQIERGLLVAVEVPQQVIPLNELPTATLIPEGIDPFAQLDLTEPDQVVQVPKPLVVERKPTPRWPLVALGFLIVALVIVIPQIIKIATPKGTLVIESNDDTIEVIVKKDNTTIIDKSKQREFVLTVGDDYQIEVAEPKDGVKLSTKKFEITRNGKTIVKVRVEKPVARTTVEPPPDTTPTVQNSLDFQEVHGASMDAVQTWMAKLPKNYRISSISARTPRQVQLFDVVAVPDAQPVKMQLFDWTLEKGAEYDELIKTQRLIGQAPFYLDNIFHSLTVLADDQKRWETWSGDAELISTKMMEGLKNQRIADGITQALLPDTLSAIIFGDGSMTYTITQTWQPNRKVEWYTNLEADELTEKIRESRERGWRPHIVNMIHGHLDRVRYLAVFTENPTHQEWDFSSKLSLAEYEQELITRKAKGQRPRCVSSSNIANAIEYMVIWEGAERPVAVRPADFREAHDLTLAALLDWHAKLPKNYLITVLGSRENDKETRFHAVATPVQVPVDTKLVLWTDNDNTPYDELAKTHRIARAAPNSVGNGHDTVLLGVADGLEWVYWYSKIESVDGRIRENLTNTQVINGVPHTFMPVSLSAKITANDADYFEVVLAYRPSCEYEWFFDLDANTLTQKVAEFRKKGWRLDLLNAHVRQSPPRYVAMFTENKTNDSWEITPELSTAEYEKQLAERKLKGQRPRCVASYYVNEKPQYTVVWDTVTATP